MPDSFPLDEYSLKLNAHYVNHLRRLYAAFDGDLEECLVLGEIAVYNTSGIQDRASMSRFNRDEAKAILKGCNAHSISLCTGIPRETVRRKIKKLKTKGWVTINERKQLIVTARVREDLGDFTIDTTQIFMRFLEGLRPEIAKTRNSL